MKTIHYLLLILGVLLFSQCEDDPCENINCGDNGRCINGICECDTGYGGADCSTALLPTSMTLSSINVSDWPLAAPDGTGWDPFDQPDVYLALINQTDNVVVTTTSISFDALPPLSFAGSFTIDSPGDQYSLSLFDNDDFSDDDFMGGIIINPGAYGQNNDFPNSAEFDLISVNGIRMTMNLSYDF